MMNRILIVDDEKWIREGIKVKLKRLGYGSDQIEEACDGREALEIMRRRPCEIVLSDIRMEGLDGLKLCETLKEEFPSAQKVIVCGYSEFDYAAKAIEVGVVSYLLKPVGFEEISKAIRLCEKNLEKLGNYRKSEEVSRLERIYMYGRQYESMLRNREKIREAIPDYRDGDCFAGFYFFIGRNIDLSPWRILKMLEKGSAGYEFDRNLLLINKSPSEYIALYLLRSEGETLRGKEIDTIRKKLTDVFEENGLWDYVCGVSDADLFPLHAVFDAREAMRHKVIYPERHFIDRDLAGQANVTYDIRNTDKLQLEYAVRKKDYAAYSEILQKILGEVREIPISYESLGHLYHTIRSVLEKIDDAETGDGSGGLFEEVWQYGSLDDIFKALKEWGMSKINISNVDGAGRKEQMIRQIREYIETYYYEEITLEQLAKNNFVSISYLSTAFHDIVGTNFQQYLNLIRLEMAKKLLLEKKYKVGMIAEMVGFSDQHYFSRVFKKNEGCTPKEYMEGMERADRSNGETKERTVTDGAEREN